MSEQPIATLERTRQIVADYGLSVRKSLGQNFLVDPQTAQRIAAQTDPALPVIEIGPGIGALTEPLLKRCPRVLAYEVDGSLIPVLEDLFAGEDRFILRRQDFRKADEAEWEGTAWNLVSDLPYYLTSDLMMKIVSASRHFRVIVVMLQKEAAAHLVDPASPKDRGPLGILTWYYCAVQTVAKVPRQCFWPQPQVDSVVLKLTPRPYPQTVGDDRRFQQFVRDSFRLRRKQLTANLAGWGLDEAVLKENGYDPRIRAEQLSVDDFIRLYEAVE